MLGLSVKCAALVRLVMTVSTLGHVLDACIWISCRCNHACPCVLVEYVSNRSSASLLSRQELFACLPLPSLSMSVRSSTCLSSLQGHPERAQQFPVARPPLVSLMPVFSSPESWVVIDFLAASLCCRRSCTLCRFLCHLGSGSEVSLQRGRGRGVGVSFLFSQASKHKQEAQVTLAAAGRGHRS